MTHTSLKADFKISVLKVMLKYIITLSNMAVVRTPANSAVQSGGRYF